MAVDFHLKIDGVPGESEDAAHTGEIDVINFSWGETQTGTMAFGAGGGAGKVQMQDFHFTMYYGKASPLLFLRCATGKTIPSATFTARKPAGDNQGDYMIINFTD